ncbi:glycoside hydrolase family 3 [Paenibacillus macquariensis subsp. macquariensis]|uniref:beta-N-acetylhexosaminidase n=2 Tax=Paenibacillus macquariensis TaxID=948756 RepID=A0ABY1JZD3_9BACL|nr:glycoside hydrolase family 3 [Paenibacillus macquariensis subsp. macquariensis]SIR02802.1 beta-N-acetylhexosaminidase [Paenibacillus macquariensis]
MSDESDMKLNVMMVWLCVILVLGGCSTSGNTGENSGTNSTTNEGVNTPPQSNVDGTTSEDLKPTEPTEPEDAAKELLKGMTTAEKIGQLVVVGMEGTIIDEDSRKFIEDFHVGGFIFYKDNIENTQQALSLINDLKKSNVANKVPLWMSVDEEGGRVTRMPKEFLKLPTNKAIGKKNDTKISNEVGQILGRELQGFGLNMDFAPVLDINSNPNNPVIGDRSFGNQAKLVSSLGIATMKGLESQGVVPVIKHFPGHGDTSVDSHIGLPVVENDLERLHKLELVPFQDAIKQQAEVVMIAHLLMPKVDPDVPASLSKKIITDLLRDELGFNGIVMTDDMTMGAIAENYDLQKASVQTVLAGTNIVLIGHDAKKGQSVIQALTDAVNHGKISEDVLNNRVYTILKVKEKYKLTNDPAKGPDVQSLNSDIQQILNKVGNGKK